MSKFILFLYYLHQFPDFTLYTTSPRYIVIDFLAHDRYFQKIAVLIEEIWGFEQIVPTFIPFIDLLNEFTGRSELFFGDIAGYFRYIVPCVHVRFQGSEDDHFAINPINVIHFLDHDGNSPDPVGIDEEETI